MNKLLCELLHAGWVLESIPRHERFLTMIDRCLLRDAVLCRMHRNDQTITVRDSLRVQMDGQDLGCLELKSLMEPA